MTEMAQLKVTYCIPLKFNVNKTHKKNNLNSPSIAKGCDYSINFITLEIFEHMSKFIYSEKFI